MGKVYVLDACALIAALIDEPGAEVIAELFENMSGNSSIIMNKLNLLEVYYDVYRRKGKFVADEVMAEIWQNPIHIINGISDGVFAEAGRLKATYKISIADAVALAEALVRGGELVTSDHHEFDAIEPMENIGFLWIR